MTLTIMRALCALTVLHPGKEEQQEVILTKVLDRLYKAYWVECQKIQERDVLEDVLVEVLGKEMVGKVFELAPKEGKALLAKNTDKAMEDGAFGLPWFVATDAKGNTEGFWGVDHIGQVVAFLGLEKLGTGGWKALL